MKRQAGFTVVELMITIVIMVILMSLSVANVRNSQAKARDEERKTDTASLALYLEGRYTRNNGTYFPSSAATSVDAFFIGADRNFLRAPGVASPDYSLVAATNAIQTTAGVLPLPTNTTYVYQPLTTTNALCTTSGACRKFNLYYMQESTKTVQMITSKNQ